MTVRSVARTRRIAAKWGRLEVVRLSDAELYNALAFVHRANWLDYNEAMFVDLEAAHRQITSEAKRYVAIRCFNPDENFL
ncbi:MAG: hypothetical protein NXH91_17205 [Phyllobacteriaceae bacterium]|nr:hypothetical protein [Phyllobacteriaceae bacterium]